jgi:hypothetical protein
MTRTVKINAKGATSIKITAEFEIEVGLTPYDVNSLLRKFEDRIVGDVLLPSYYARDIEVK